MPTLRPLAFLVSGLFAVPLAHAADVQKVKPPVSQAWIDLATFSGGMPAMPGAGVGGMLGSIFGGGAAKGGNVFGNAAHGSAGRWMDVTLLTRNNPNLKTATQAVPAPSKLAPSLKLLAPEPEKTEKGTPGTPVAMGQHQMPKGKMYLYWGCGTEVRKGQPLVLDLSKMDISTTNKFFQNRSATTSVPSPAPGRPVWPNKDDQRMLPDGASMVGEHAFTGEGVPEGFKFNIDAEHDLMPAISVQQRDDAKSVQFSWQPMPQARAWFITSMGMRNPEKMANGGEMEMVYWTSSELPDMGMGLLNYQPDAAIQRWLKEKVLLAPKTTECAAPREAISPQGMTRMIAYGDELNMAYPPRPKDPKITWEPQWDVKVRLKSVASLMPGMGSMAAGMAAAGRDPEVQGNPGVNPGSQGMPQQAPAAPTTGDLIRSAAPSAFDLLRMLKK